MKKFLYFFGSFLALIGGIGSLGWALYLHEFMLAIGIAVIDFAAIPTIKNWIKKLMQR